MKLEFIDPLDGQLYTFEINPEPGIKQLHVEITIIRPPLQCSSSTIRRAPDKCIEWVEGDDFYISKAAQNYIGRVIKNLPFI